MITVHTPDGEAIEVDERSILVVHKTVPYPTLYLWDGRSFEVRERIIVEKPPPD